MNILALCTGNSARSILAEALFGHLGRGEIQAFSAGSQPTGRVNPYALTTLAAHGITLTNPSSKSWDFQKTHWGIPDPAAVTGSDADKRAAFETAYQQLRTKINHFYTLRQQVGTLTQAQLDSIADL